MGNINTSPAIVSGPPQLRSETTSLLTDNAMFLPINLSEVPGNITNLTYPTLNGMPQFQGKYPTIPTVCFKMSGDKGEAWDFLLK